MRALLLVGLTVVAALLGCAEPRDPATPEGAMHRLRDAVLAQDAPAILAAASANTQRALAQLHTKLKEQRAAIDERYPADAQAAARAAFPPAVLEAKDSAALFAALIEPQMKVLDRGPGLKWGMTVLGRPTVTDGRATVPTQSGETLEFVLEEGRWQTTAFERALELNLNRVKLNEQTLAENLKVFEELKRREADSQAKAAEDE